MEDKIRELQEAAWAFYATSSRHDLPWREPEDDGSFDAYKVLVSELMLQQTQVSRVIPKFNEFIGTYPTVQSLSDAQLGDVLRAWQGLGYNRRAKYLWQAAQKVVSDFNGTVPMTKSELVTLPGVGQNTAGAVLTYAYNEPEVFIETNIRTVVIYHCFREVTGVSEQQIREVVALAMQDVESPREWYWALMDYGSALKKMHGNLNKLSITYNRQSTFHGSKRQVRGKILRLLSIAPKSKRSILNEIQDDRTIYVLNDLTNEGLVHLTNGRYHL